MDEAEPEETGERRPRRLRRGGSKKEAVQKVIESEGDNSEVEAADNDESNYDPSHDNKKKSKHDKVKASRKLVLTRKTRKAKAVDQDEEHESLKDEQVADDGSIIPSQASNCDQEESDPDESLPVQDTKPKKAKAAPKNKKPKKIKAGEEEEFNPNKVRANNRLVGDIVCNDLYDDDEDGKVHSIESD